MAKNLFFLGLIVAASGLVSPPLALTFGLIYGLAAVHPYHVDSRKLSRFLLPIPFAYLPSPSISKVWGKVRTLSASQASGVVMVMPIGANTKQRSFYAIENLPSCACLFSAVAIAVTDGLIGLGSSGKFYRNAEMETASVAGECDVGP